MGERASAAASAMVCGTRARGLSASPVQPRRRPHLICAARTGHLCRHLRAVRPTTLVRPGDLMDGRNDNRRALRHGGGSLARPNLDWFDWGSVEPTESTRLGILAVLLAR